jgi:hypothetical protein
VLRAPDLAAVADHRQHQLLPKVKEAVRAGSVVLLLRACPGQPPRPVPSCSQVRGWSGEALSSRNDHAKVLALLNMLHWKTSSCARAGQQPSCQPYQCDHHLSFG